VGESKLKDQVVKPVDVLDQVLPRVTSGNKHLN